MPNKCCVVGCSKRSDRDKGVGFFRFPALYQKKLHEISMERRQAWLNAIKRKDLRIESLKITRVCSEHFITGSPAKLSDKLHPDWIPNKNMGYSLRTPVSVQRFNRSKNRESAKELQEEIRNKDKVIQKYKDQKRQDEEDEKEENNIYTMVFMRCCVPNCVDKESKRHRFPNPKKNLENMEKWKSLFPISVFKNYSNDKIYQNLRICALHFDKTCYSIGYSKLNYDAFPTLLMPEIETEELLGAEEFLETEELMETQEVIEIKHFFDTKEIYEDVDFIETLESRNNNEIKISKKLIKKIQSFQKELRKLIILRGNGKIIELRKKLQKKSFRKLCKSLSPTIIHLVAQKLNFFSKKPKGRNFNVDEIILGLSLMKHGSLKYSFFSKVFDLPSKRTLNEILKESAVKPGFDQKFFEYITKTLKHLKPLQKMCTLMFDTINLKTDLGYNNSEDKIIGFQNFGDGEVTQTLADHAIIFMLCGIFEKWKQPVMYYILESTCSAIRIKEAITKIINTAQKANLEVVSIVCDSCANNMAALKMLKQNSKVHAEKIGNQYHSCGFEINRKTINIIIDPSHLLKSIRNHFMKKSLVFRENNLKKLAKWEHIINFYKIDSGLGRLKMSQLTERHVINSRINKNDISYCVQVFSETVGKLMLYAIGLCKNVKTDSSLLGLGADDTASCIIFFDRLFDSMNGSISTPKKGKELRGPFGEIQQEFWDNEAIPKLRSMYFKKDSKIFKPLCIENILNNIENFREITNKLKMNNSECIYLRNFCMDPLKYFFISIRSLNLKSIIPSCTQFLSSYRTLLIDNMLSLHLVNSKNLKDSNELLIQILKVLKKSPSKDLTNELHYQFEDNISNLSPMEYKIEEKLSAYVATFLVKKFKNVGSKCGFCKKFIFTKPNVEIHDYITSRENTNNKSLYFLNIQFINNFIIINRYFIRNFAKFCHETNILFKLKNAVLDLIHFEDLCSLHGQKIITLYLNYCLKLLMKNYCLNINRQLTN